ncbi:helix-turn-helix transcriptional regulator [Clostridium tyrobutyricum]|jgi:DNA-binding HxlR family transcriptional regulator|uniref:winged helix-turn-helix transcriptional regulator n=1 Tax=Clostridium tyrobutyricum TaxID=1519 RepID=UPI00057F6D0B|nr:helix-turn-helix domain-containing protein [Clostridium tyrobutyricum]MBV4417800.1 helix-turn-helix transcriptional regulator [Clostridium tyrobutyricum]MBV4427933.1 helix-turn-helix transcriptional regulator [Clostridium tyrobutyricum]MBV4440645.1 helix-turn-helix transcriptional regulator [Clostridium tyrobutyricum]MBV4443989.1 helix-turn-helix transcriptional regulator [Clostridium tyrobutyricum]MBV4449722.1 helix-turn-helix transcriptional regulator [Clostridium tyrobutyricum]
MKEKLCYVGNREPFEYTLSIISGKWKLKIIYLLVCMGTVRYGVLKRNIDGITHKMLSSQLKELQNKDIILRKQYMEMPPKVEYSLSKKGESLIPIVKAMCKWGEEHND